MRVSPYGGSQHDTHHSYPNGRQLVRITQPPLAPAGSPEAWWRPGANGPPGKDWYFSPSIGNHTELSSIFIKMLKQNIQQLYRAHNLLAITFTVIFFCLLYCPKRYFATNISSKGECISLKLFLANQSGALSCLVSPPLSSCSLPAAISRQHLSISHSPLISVSTGDTSSSH